MAGEGTIRVARYLESIRKFNHTISFSRSNEIKDMMVFDAKGSRIILYICSDGYLGGLIDATTEELYDHESGMPLRDVMAKRLKPSFSSFLGEGCTSGLFCGSLIPAFNSLVEYGVIEQWDPTVKPNSIIGGITEGNTTFGIVPIPESVYSVLSRLQGIMESNLNTAPLLGNSLDKSSGIMSEYMEPATKILDGLFLSQFLALDLEEKVEIIGSYNQSFFTSVGIEEITNLVTILNSRLNGGLFDM